MTLWNHTQYSLSVCRKHQVPCPPSKCTRSNLPPKEWISRQIPAYFPHSPPPYGVHISRCINMQRSLPRFRSAERFFSCKIHGKMFYPNSLCLIWRCHVSFSLWGMVQFGNPKPLRTNCHSGARVQIPASTPYMGWVCFCFAPLLREVFLRVLWFSPLLKNQHFQIPIRYGTRGHV